MPTRTATAISRNRSHRESASAAQQSRRHTPPVAPGLTQERPPTPRPIQALLAHAEQALANAQPAEAIASLQHAVRLQPSNAALQHDLGYLCQQAGRFAEAAAAFDAALAANPGFALAALRLGTVRQALGQTEAALAAYRRAMALPPAVVEAGFRAAALLETLGRRTDAIATFRQAAAAAPDSSLGRLCSARALLADDRDAEAEAILRTLLAAEPGHAAANDLLGLILADSGRFEQARACYERAVAAAPLLAGSYYDLVRCRRIPPSESALYPRIRAALDTPGLPAASRVRVHLALGKVADDLGDPAAAMRHFDAADAERSRLARFDPAAFEARTERLMARLPSGPAIPPGAEAGPSPIFIMGLPRSGTTLVEQIVSSHADVHPAGELPFWTERAAEWEHVPPVDRPRFLAAAAADYRGLLSRLAPGARWVTDKMPLNILNVGLIHLALPDATLICCRRHPLDTALSIHRTYFNPHVAFPTGGAALVAAVRAVERLAAHWRAVLPEDRLFELDYDQLVAEPEPHIRALIGACGLPWTAACLQPERNRRIIKTPSKWQARQPIARPVEPPSRRFKPWLGALAALA